MADLVEPTTTPVGEVEAIPTTTGGENVTLAIPAKTEIWELSDYEMERTPQDAVTDTDDTEVTLLPGVLQSEFKCPICLELLHETMTTKECLHRFCSECIATALRTGNKECPTCRKKLVSKRSLRRDTNFDELIASIYPSRDDYDAEQQQALAPSKDRSQAQFRMPKQIAKSTTKVDPNNGSSQNASTEEDAALKHERSRGNFTAGSSQSLTSESNGSRGMRVAPPVGAKMRVTRADSAGKNSSYNLVGPENVTDVELVFKPHPDMQVGTSGSSLLSNDLSRVRFIKTSENATVDHLRHYLGMRLASDSEGGDCAESLLRNCTIWICPRGKFIKLLHELTLEQICDKYWPFNKPLEVYYHWKEN